MGKAYSDKLFRGQIVQALLTCNPDVFRCLWMSYADPLLCPLDRCRRTYRGQCSYEYGDDPEVMELILGHGRRW